MGKSIYCILLKILLFFSSNAHSIGLNKCQDEKGRILYTQTDCPTESTIEKKNIYEKKISPTQKIEELADLYIKKANLAKKDKEFKTSYTADQYSILMRSIAQSLISCPSENINKAEQYFSQAESKIKEMQKREYKDKVGGGYAVPSSYDLIDASRSLKRLGDATLQCGQSINDEENHWQMDEQFRRLNRKIDTIR